MLLQIVWGAECRFRQRIIHQGMSGSRRQTMFLPIPLSLRTHLSHSLKIALRSIQIKREGFGKIAADHAVDKKLTDFPVPVEDELRAVENQPFLGGKRDDDLLQGLARPGLVHPDVHQVQRINDKDFFQITGLLVEETRDISLFNWFCSKKYGKKEIWEVPHVFSAIATF
jgi:hypothetical protein